MTETPDRREMGQLADFDEQRQCRIDAFDVFTEICG